MLWYEVANISITWENITLFKQTNSTIPKFSQVVGDGGISGAHIAHMLISYY